MRTAYHADYAWLGGDVVAADVLIEIEGSRIARVEPGVALPGAGARSGLGTGVVGAGGQRRDQEYRHEERAHGGHARKRAANRM